LDGRGKKKQSQNQNQKPKKTKTKNIMPFEARIFSFTPNDASAKYDRRDIYLVGSDAS